MYRLFRVRKHDPRCWGLMPWVFARVYKFTESHDTVVTPQEMCELVQNAFIADSPFLALWVVVSEQGDIVGHMLATAEPWGAEVLRYIMIRQAQVDPKVDIREQTAEAFQLCREWAKSLGVNKLTMLTPRKAETFARRWGFTKVRTMMERKLDT